jgi:hypothetical protein
MSEKRARQRQTELKWEELAEKITRGYARLPLHQLSQSRGQYIMDSFKVIHDWAESLGYADDSDEINKRSLSRIFEKLGNVTETPSAMLAYEFLRLRDEGKLD